MQRSAVASDVQRGPSDQRAQLCEIELSAFDDRRALVDASSRARASSAIAAAAAASDGPDVRMIRRFGSFDASRHTSSTNDADGQRRNGLPALTCTTITGLPAPMPASASRRATADAAAGIVRHLRRVDLRIGRSDAERQQHIPLADDRMPRSQRSRPRHARRVHPASSGDFVADPRRRAAEPRQHRAARAAVKVDGEIVSLAPQPSDERDIGAQAAGRVRAARDDHLVEVRIVAHDGGSFFFDDVGDAGVGVVAADGSNGRSREYDIADQSEPDEENVQMPIYFSIVASSMSMTGMSSLIG